MFRKGNSYKVVFYTSTTPRLETSIVVSKMMYEAESIFVDDLSSMGCGMMMMMMTTMMMIMIIMIVSFSAVLRDEDDLDIDAIIEMNKETLPRLPDISTTGGPLKSKMKGLKGNPADDEETRKGKSYIPVDE